MNVHVEYLPCFSCEDNTREDLGVWKAGTFYCDKCYEEKTGKPFPHRQKWTKWEEQKEEYQKIVFDVGISAFFLWVLTLLAFFGRTMLS